MSAIAKAANPYDFIGDVKDRRLFAGRRSEIAVIREELAKLAAPDSIPPVIALVGERRVGKTSLLRRVSEICAEYRVLPCWINITSTLATDSGEFWYEVFQQLLSSVYREGISCPPGVRDPIGFTPTQPEPQPQPKPSPPPLRLPDWYHHRSHMGGPSPPPLSIINSDLKTLSETVVRGQYNGLLLMFDEAHFLAKSLDVLQSLRYVVREAQRCGIVFAGERDLNQMFTDSKAPFYLQARIIPIGNFLLKSDIAECALLPLTQDERSLMSPMTIDHLYRLSHGKPNQVRLICHSIYTRYQRGHQKDLNMTIEAIDDVLDIIQASYASEYDLKQRVDMIRTLNSVDLELLYLLTRYPEWRADDVVALDEAFRGEKVSPRAAARRARRLRRKAMAFVSARLLQDQPDRYMLAGDEFLQLYLRFLYEVRKYGELSKRLQLGEAPTTLFRAKADKLVSSLAFEMGQPVALVVFRFDPGEQHRTKTIARVRHRFSVLKAALNREPVDLIAERIALLESFDLCQLIAKRIPCYLLVISLRNLENPRESLLLEIYFEADRILAFPMALLTEHAEAARILVEDFDGWVVTLPTLEELVETTSGRTLDEIMTHSSTVEQWVIRSIRKHVKESTAATRDDKKEGEDEKQRGNWVELYRRGERDAAVEALTKRLAENPQPPIAARCYNDRGYIRYEVKNDSEGAKRDLEHAVDLHHSLLPLTLLNLSVIAIDNGEFARAVEWIEDALVITHGRETVSASFLRLRLLPAHLLHLLVAKRERFEQHPANVIEAGYINLAYAVAHEVGYQAAKEILEEGLEVIPSSVHLRHALARLHLWQQRADLADPLYDDMANRPIPSKELAHEIEAYMKVPRGRRKG